MFFDEADTLLGKRLSSVTQGIDNEVNAMRSTLLIELEKFKENNQNLLNENQIFPRRYFYPSLNELNYVEHFDTPISEDISRRILCLPLFDDLENKDVIKICQIIRDALKLGL